eukprot:TRINITY_DN2081_c0_g3_i1.p1 TRINITY_DN2081_c0_g3~~TRINITY_DN2081_c0_g3_i1.p1  ORF type:complete len:186 (+),score=37.87 TRINITY_DN2081_c0_g3_i1:47-604(+)
MACTILCAADLWGTKVNYELVFPSFPTSMELQQKVEDVFAPEHAARRPSDVPPTQSFDIDRMQTFDEKAQQWVDLLTPAQLQDFSQVYIFQRENEYHREVQSKIPPPVPAPITRALALANTPSKVTSPEPSYPATYSSLPKQAPHQSSTQRISSASLAPAPAANTSILSTGGGYSGYPVGETPRG